MRPSGRLPSDLNKPEGDRETCRRESAGDQIIKSVMSADDTKIWTTDDDDDDDADDEITYFTVR